jgi:hypothetical protein
VPVGLVCELMAIPTIKQIVMVGGAIVTQQGMGITSLSEANREGDMGWRAVWVAGNGFRPGKFCRNEVHRLGVLPSKSAQELHRLSFVCGPPEAVNRRNPL